MTRYEEDRPELDRGDLGGATWGLAGMSKEAGAFVPVLGDVLIGPASSEGTTPECCGKEGGSQTALLVS